MPCAKPQHLPPWCPGGPWRVPGAVLQGWVSGAVLWGGSRAGAGLSPHKSCSVAAPPLKQLPSGGCPAGRRAVKGIQHPATHLWGETLWKVPAWAARADFTCWELGNEQHPTPFDTNKLKAPWQAPRKSAASPSPASPFPAGPCPPDVQAVFPGCRGLPSSPPSPGSYPAPSSTSSPQRG